MTTPTNNDIPSNSIQDRLFNSEKLDEVVNSESTQYTDRKGVKRYTLSGLRQLVVNWISSMGTPEGASNLGTQSGLSVQKEISGLNSIEEIRNLEPTQTHQKVRIFKLKDGGAVINEDIYYDQDDKTSLDDGYSVFVTHGGARWKIDSSNGINVFWGGLNSNGDNLGKSINKIVNGELNKLFSSSGNFTNITTLINLPSIKNLLGSEGYILDEPIHLPSFFSISASGYVNIRYNLTDKPAVTINNQLDGLTSEMGSYINMQGSKIFSSRSGMIRLIGPGTDVSTSSGILFGNAQGGSEILDVRDTIISDLHVRGFKIGLEPHAFDTYICSFENCHLVGNYWNLGTTAVDKMNSGEKIIFKGCVIANSVSHNIYWNMVGWNVTFDNCSIDYAGGSTLYFDNGGRGNIFRFVNGTFLEGFVDYLLEQGAMSSSWSYNKNLIVFSDAFIDAASKTQSGWHPRRQIIKAPYDNNLFVFTNTPIHWPSSPSEPYLALYGYDKTTSKYNQGVYSCPVSPYEQPLLKYSDGLNGDKCEFSGEAGEIVTLDVATNYAFNKSSGMNVVYGDKDVDGLVPVKITSAANTEVLEIINKDLFVQIPHNGEINGGCSIKMTGVTEGSPAMSVKLYLLGNRVYTSAFNSSTSVVTTQAEFSRISNYSSDFFDVGALLGVNGTPLTTEKYVGVQASKKHIYSDPSKSILINPGLVITGFTGVIYLKLPVFWLTNGLNQGQSISR